MRKLRLNGPGLVVAVIAMVVALTGGAFAASSGLTAKEKKQVKAIAQTEAKKLQGSGPAGPAGSVGPAGAKGDKGDKGEKAKSGEPGSAGASVLVSPVATEEPECAGRGGGLVEEEGKPASQIEVCNGEEGKEGSPWTVDGTLPPGKVETGSWAFAATPADTAGVHVAIPFFIPLAGPLEGHVHYQFDADFFTFCEGNAEFPKPKAGELCVYVNTAETPEEIAFQGIFSASFEEKGASPQGAILKFGTPTINTAGGGTYAVRAPLAP